MNILETINELVIGLIDAAGYPGIFLAMFVEGIFTPIPSEIIVPFAGYLASIGRLDAILVVLVSSLGAVTGSTVAYFIGRRLGRPFMDRFGRYFGFGADSMCRAEAWFKRWGSYGILIGHSLPGIRSVISFPAGISKMDLRRFVLFTFIGAMVWNTVLTAAGYLLGEYYISIAERLDGWDLVILAAVGAIFVTWVVYGRWRHKRMAGCDSQAPGEK